MHVADLLVADLLVADLPAAAIGAGCENRPNQLTPPVLTTVPVVCGQSVLKQALASPRYCFTGAGIAAFVANNILCEVVVVFEDVAKLNIL